MSDIELEALANRLNEKLREVPGYARHAREHYLSLSCYDVAELLALVNVERMRRAVAR